MLESLEAHTSLSPAVAAVLQRIACGETDEEIAETLALKVGTVRSRLRRFYRRTGFSGRRAVAWAIEHRACCIAICDSSATESQLFRDIS